MVTRRTTTPPIHEVGNVIESQGLITHIETCGAQWLVLISFIYKNFMLLMIMNYLWSHDFISIFEHSWGSGNMVMLISPTLAKVVINSSIDPTLVLVQNLLKLRRPHFGVRQHICIKQCCRKGVLLELDG
jgi:hypothetical protein